MFYVLQKDTFQGHFYIMRAFGSNEELTRETDLGRYD
jgi:hypothetical protein